MINTYDTEKNAVVTPAKASPSGCISVVCSCDPCLIYFIADPASMDTCQTSLNHDEEVVAASAKICRTARQLARPLCATNSRKSGHITEHSVKRLNGIIESANAMGGSLPKPDYTHVAEEEAQGQEDKTIQIS